MVVEPETGYSLLCRAGALLCALPIEHVVETMRPSAIDALPGMPDFVAGVTVVRGAPLPVIVVSRLFGGKEQRPARLVVVRAGARRVGFAVDAVVGVRALPRDLLQRLPPLLGDTARDAVADIGTLDGELMVVLQAARIVPDEVFAGIEPEAAAS